MVLIINFQLYTDKCWISVQKRSQGSRWWQSPGDCQKHFWFLLCVQWNNQWQYRVSFTCNKRWANSTDELVFIGKHQNCEINRRLYSTQISILHLWRIPYSNSWLLWLSLVNWFIDTGYSLSEALILASIKPKYDIKICSLFCKKLLKSGFQITTWELKSLLAFLFLILHTKLNNGKFIVILASYLKDC